MSTRSKIVVVLMVGTLGALVPLAALLPGCGASANGTAEFPGNGNDAGIPQFDASGLAPPHDGAPAGADSGIGFNDASVESDGTIPTPGPTSILVVHASANLVPFRLCFGVGTAVPDVLPYLPYPDDPAQPMPDTNIPGVPVGGAALLPPITFANGSPGSDVLVTPYVLPAISLFTTTDVPTSSSAMTCAQLLCDGCLTQYADYMPLPPFPVPYAGGTIVLAIEGCLEGVPGLSPPNGPPGSPAQCGATFANSAATYGNLTATASPLIPGPIDDAGGFNLQIAQLSPSLSVGSGAPLTYVDPATDASLPLAASAVLPFPGDASIATIPPLSPASALAAYFVVGGGSEEAGAAVTQTLASIQYFQSPASDPTTYFNSAGTYFAAIVGDATDAAAPASLPDGGLNPAFDGHGLHVIAYPELGN